MRDLTLIVAMFRLLVFVTILATAIAVSLQVFPEGRMTKYDYSIEVKLSVNKINFWTAAKINSLLEVHNQSGILTTLVKDVDVQMFHSQILTPQRRDEPIMPMLYTSLSGETIDMIREEMKWPTSFKMNAGHIENITFAGEYYIAKNVKRGLIQLLQAPPTIRGNYTSGQTEKRYEATVLGFCETSYIYSPCNDPSLSQCQQVIKSINLKKCIGEPERKNTELNPLLEKIKNDTKDELATVKYMIHKQQDEIVVERVSGYSILYETPTMKRDGQVTVQFIQSLLRRSSEISERQVPNNLTQSTGVELITEIPSRHMNKMPTSNYIADVAMLITLYRKNNESLAYIVYEIKNLLKSVSEEQLNQLLKKYSTDPLNKNLLWDILPAVDNDVIRKSLKDVTVDMLYDKPLLLPLFVEHQSFSEETFEELKKLVSEIEKNTILERTSLLALSNYAHKCISICEKLRLKYQQYVGLLKSTDAEFPQIPHGTKLLLEQLQAEIQSHNLTRESMLKYFIDLFEKSHDKALPLVLLKNFGDPESLPLLVNIIRNEPNMTLRVLALDALLRMPLESVIENVNTTLINLYMSAETPVTIRLRIFKALIVNSLNDNIWQLLVSSIRYEPDCYVAKWVHTYIKQLAESEYRPIRYWTLKARKALVVWPVEASPCFESQKGVMDIYRLIKERVLYPLHISKHLESIQESIALDIQLLPVANYSWKLIVRARISSKLVHHDYELHLDVNTKSLQLLYPDVNTKSLQLAMNSTRLYLLKDAGVVFSFDRDSLGSVSKLLNLSEVIVSSKEERIPTLVGSLLHEELSQVYIPKIESAKKVKDVIELVRPRLSSYWESRAYLDGQYMKPGIGIYEEVKADLPATLKINIEDKSVSVSLKKDKIPILDVYKSFYNFVEFEPTHKLAEEFIPKLIQDDFVQPDSRILACALELGPLHLGGICPESWKQPISAFSSSIYGTQHNRVFVETTDISKSVKAVVSMKSCSNQSSGSIVNLALLAEDGSKYINISGGVCWVIEETKLKAEVIAELIKNDAEKKQFKAIVKIPLKKPAPVECLWEKEYQEQVKEQLTNVSKQNIEMLPYLVPHMQARMADELNVLTQYSTSKPDPKVLPTVKDSEMELRQMRVLEKVEQQRLSISSLNLRKDFTKLVEEVLHLNEQVMKYINESVKIAPSSLLLKIKQYHQINVIIARQVRIIKRVEEIFKSINITINNMETLQREHLRKQLVSLRNIYIENVRKHEMTVSLELYRQLPVERRVLYQNFLTIEKLYLQLNERNINETSRNISQRLDILVRNLPQLFDFDSSLTEMQMIEYYRLRFHSIVLLNESHCHVRCKFQNIQLKTWQLQQDVVIYEKLLSEIEYYNMTCDKLSASCFSLNLKYMVLRLLHDFMEYKTSIWENILEERPQKVFSSFQQLYQTMEVGVKLIEMKEPNLQGLAEDGGLPLYIELNEFLVKLQEISLHLLNEPTTEWHEMISESIDIRKKQLKKSIIDLFDRVERISNVESSKLVKPHLHVKSKICDIPKSIEAEIIFEINQTPLVTWKANFQKTPEQLKKEVDIGLYYMIKEETLERPFANITEDLTRSLNSYKSVSITIDWQNKTLPQPVVTALGHVRDLVKYLLQDYLVIKSVPESQINGINIGIQQTMKSKMVNVRFHAGSKVYLITSIPVPVDILITPPSYKVVMLGLQVVKSSKLSALHQTTRMTTTTTPVPLMEEKVTGSEDTEKSSVNKRFVRSVEQSSQPTTRGTTRTTQETLLSEIIKKTVSAETIVSSSTTPVILGAKETRTVTPVTTTKFESTTRRQTTTPVTKQEELHKVRSAEDTRRSTPVPLASKEEKHTLPSNLKVESRIHSTTPSVERTTTVRPATLKTAVHTATTPHTTKVPRQEGINEKVTRQTEATTRRSQ